MKTVNKAENDVAIELWRNGHKDGERGAVKYEKPRRKYQKWDKMCKKEGT